MLKKQAVQPRISKIAHCAQIGSGNEKKSEEKLLGMHPFSTAYFKSTGFDNLAFSPRPRATLRALYHWLILLHKWPLLQICYNANDILPSVYLLQR